MIRVGGCVILLVLTCRALHYKLNGNVYRNELLIKLLGMIRTGRCLILSVNVPCLSAFHFKLNGKVYFTDLLIILLKIIRTGHCVNLFFILTARERDKGLN